MKHMILLNTGVDVRMEGPGPAPAKQSVFLRLKIRQTTIGCACQSYLKRLEKGRNTNKAERHACRAWVYLAFCFFVKSVACAASFSLAFLLTWHQCQPAHGYQNIIELTLYGELFASRSMRLSVTAPLNHWRIIARAHQLNLLGNWRT
jgi:hypothetical protein